MSSTAVVYQSRYGSTSRYAHWIADKTDAALIKLSDLTPSEILLHSTIIFGSPIFAGTLGCARFMRQNAETLKKRRIGLFVVGLGPLDSPDRLAVCDTALPRALHSWVDVFQLRGAIDYSKLSLAHRLIIKVVDRQTVRRARKNPTTANRECAAQVGKNMNYVEPATVEPIVGWALRQAA